MNYSVLMSVYHKEKPLFLKSAMDSIWNQTVKTDDFVLVCDGPLTDQLNEVIRQMQIEHKDELTVLRLEKNNGLGIALNYGLKQCNNELVARMDSDDISFPDRCEKQLNVFKHNKDISIVSGTIAEFENSIDTVIAERRLPEKNDEIVSFARKRTPFNHPCTMYKKKAVEDAGGYQDFYLLEDYYLWIRMLCNGEKGYNIQEPILWMRTGAGMYKRRSGLKYVKSQLRLFRYMRKRGFISRAQLVKSSILRTIGSLIPTRIRKKGYQLFLRSN